MSMQTDIASVGVVGIVGIGGAYGRWLQGFLQTRMGVQVIGHDPVTADSVSEQELLARAQVLIFSAPIRHTPALIQRYVELAAGRERGQLWLDVTSIKQQPVAAMLQSQAEVVGLHPMGMRGAPAAMAAMAAGVVRGAGSRMRARRTRASRPGDGLGAGDGACHPSGAGRGVARLPADAGTTAGVDAVSNSFV
jgi:hypothetical protein